MLRADHSGVLAVRTRQAPLVALADLTDVQVSVALLTLHRCITPWLWDVGV